MCVEDCVTGQSVKEKRFLEKMKDLNSHRRRLPRGVFRDSTMSLSDND